MRYGNDAKERLAEYIVDELWIKSKRYAGSAFKVLGDSLYLEIAEIIKKGGTLEQLNQVRLALEQVV